MSIKQSLNNYINYVKNKPVSEMVIFSLLITVLVVLAPWYMGSLYADLPRRKVAGDDDPLTTDIGAILTARNFKDGLVILGGWIATTFLAWVIALPFFIPAAFAPEDMRMLLHVIGWLVSILALFVFLFAFTAFTAVYPHLGVGAVKDPRTWDFLKRNIGKLVMIGLVTFAAVSLVNIVNLFTFGLGAFLITGYVIGLQPWLMADLWASYQLEHDAAHWPRPADATPSATQPVAPAEETAKNLSSQTGGDTQNADTAHRDNGSPAA